MNKQVIFGTTEYHELMRQIATHSLQRKAGYIAPKMAASRIQRTPVHENYLERVDPMMQALANDENLVNCNPRALFLLLAWLLVGSDNPYRSCQYVDDTRLHKQAAIIHIRIASGDTPTEGEINAARKNVTTTVIKAAKVADWVGMNRAEVWTAASDVAWNVANEAPKGMPKGEIWDATWDAARNAIKNKALLFAKIDDCQALSTARQLTIDILALKDCNAVE